MISKVFDNAAKHVMRIGPKIGWKLSAWAKLRYVFPNQICTINHAIFPIGHLSEAEDVNNRVLSLIQDSHNMTTYQESKE